MLRQRHGIHLNDGKAEVPYNTSGRTTVAYAGTGKLAADFCGADKPRGGPSCSNLVLLRTG